MTNRFVSFFETIGHDFKVGLPIATKIAETGGAVAVGIFAPALGPLYNQTVATVVTAEQSFAAMGKQTGSGPQKLAMVLNIMGPLIKQALADVGKSQDDAEVEKYISAIVTILNLIPAPPATATATSGPSA